MPPTTDPAMENNPSPTPLLFNDVYFNSWVKPLAPSPPVWAPFPRLPFELRLRIWYLALQQHRMIELDLCHTAGEDHVPNYAGGCDYGSHYTDDQDYVLSFADDSDGTGYADRNHLGRIVSSRTPSYTCRLRGRGSYAASLSVLLRVSREARAAALSFYHIHLPLSTGEVLYLSSECDVVYVRFRKIYYIKPLNAMLVDLLHDARAYDYKDHGYGGLLFYLTTSNV